MSQNQVKDLQEKLACQYKELCHLREKLSKYNEIIAEKDVLHKRFIELQRWVEDSEINQKRSIDEQLTIIERQFKKLEKSELAVTSLRAENHRLNNVKECQAKQLKTKQRDEKRLMSDIEKIESSKKNLETELCNAKDELDEKRCTAETLAEQSKCVEDELRCARKELEASRTAVNGLGDACNDLEKEAARAKAELRECQATGCRLRERCRDLEAEAACGRAKLEDARTRATAAEARLKAEADGLAAELECRARKLRAAETERDEWKRRAAEGQCDAARLGALAAELRAAGDRERCEAEAREQRLRRDVRDRDEEARRRDEQLTAARLEHEDAARAAAALGARVRAAEGQLDEAKRSAEARARADDEARARLEREKAALSCDVRRRTADAAELERQACRLRDQLVQQQQRRLRCCAVACSPQPPGPFAAADGSGCAVTADDSFVGKLKRLYRDLESSDKNRPCRRY